MSNDVNAPMSSQQRIEEIKEVRRITNCGLWESKAAHDEAQSGEDECVCGEPRRSHTIAMDPYHVFVLSKDESPPDPPQYTGIVANFSGDSSIRPGAKCWICHGSDVDRIRVWVLSRSGRRICKFVPTWRLSNFRTKPIFVLPNELMTWEDAGEAKDAAIAWDKVAREERARRNVCEIERLSGQMDKFGKRIR
jgi:hypothetical protein